jgi:hypothetical protein
MTNLIPEKQNLEPFLRLLRARSQVYKEAVRWQVVQLVLTVVVPLLGGLVGIIVPATRPYVGALAVIIAISDTMWIDRYYRRKLKTAARVSEQFDCELLDIPWNKFAAGKPLDPEAVEAYATEWRGGDSKLVDWYPPVVGKAALYQARVVCQRTNLWYDSELRRRYGLILLGGAVTLIVALAGAGMVAKLSVGDLVFTVMTPAAPVLIWAIRDYFRQRDAAESLEAIKGEVEGLLEKVAEGNCIPEEAGVRSREFQDAIYSRRATNPLLFPLLYNRMRPGMEMRMNVGAAELIRRIGVEV